MAEKKRRRKIKPSYLLPKPVSVGDEVDVEIEGISKRGEGVARIQGYVIFIPNTKPGDKVRIRVTSIKPSFATGEVIEA